MLNSLKTDYWVGVRFELAKNLIMHIILRGHLNKNSMKFKGFTSEFPENLSSLMIIVNWSWTTHVDSRNIKEV